MNLYWTLTSCILKELIIMIQKAFIKANKKRSGNKQALLKDTGADVNHLSFVRTANQDVGL